MSLARLKSTLKNFSRSGTALNEAWRKSVSKSNTAAEGLWLTLVISIPKEPSVLRMRLTHLIRSQLLFLAMVRATSASHLPNEIRKRSAFTASSEARPHPCSSSEEAVSARIYFLIRIYANQKTV